MTQHHFDQRWRGRLVYDRRNPPNIGTLLYTPESSSYWINSVCVCACTCSSCLQYLNDVLRIAEITYKFN